MPHPVPSFLIPAETSHAGGHPASASSPTLIGMKMKTLSTLLVGALLIFGAVAQAGVLPVHHSAVVVRKHAVTTRYVTRRVYVRVPVAHRVTVWRTSVRRFWMGRTEVTVTRRTPSVRTTYTYQLKPAYIRVAVRR